MSLSDTKSRGQSLRARASGGSHSPTTPHPRVRNTSPAFIGVATKGGSFVHADILDSFTAKQESQQIIRESFKGIHGLVEPLFDPVSLARHMEANTAHARAVRTKAQDVAGQGWELTPLVEEPSEEQLLLLEEFFEDLEEDIEEVLVQAMTDRESIGWLSIEIARLDKKPEGPVVLIKNIPAHTMRAHEDGKRFVQIRGGKRVWFKKASLTDIDVDKRSGAIHEAGTLPAEERANEVMWNNIYTARSDVYGVPDHIPAVGAILGDVARRDYNIVFFENFGVPAYAVFISGDYDPGEPEDDEGNTQEDIDGGAVQVGSLKTPLHRSIELHLQEIASNPHSVLLLSIPSNEGGQVEVKFEKLAVEIKEASFRLYRMDNLKEVLSAHAMPPYRAGIAEAGSLGGSVAEQTDEIYRDGVLIPRQRMLERMMNRHVLRSLEITDWSFDLLALNIEDESRELDFDIVLFEHGVATPNDLIRKYGNRFGVDAVDHPAMDAHYLNGTPLDAVLSSDVEQVMVGLRENLLTIASEHVESGDEDGSLTAELFGLIAGLQASATATASNGKPTSSATKRSNGTSNGRRTPTARGSRTRTQRHRRNAAGHPVLSGGNGA